MATKSPTNSEIAALLQEKRAERDELNATVEPIVEARVEAELEKRLEGQNLSAAKRRVLGLIRADSGPQYVRVFDEGDPEPWVIRKFGTEGLTLIGMMCDRDEQGRIQLDQEGQMTGFLAALFFTCLYEEEGGAKLFEDFKDAYALADSKTEEGIGTVNFLFNEISKVNPSIFPERAKEARRAQKQSDFLAHSAKVAESSN